MLDGVDVPGNRSSSRQGGGARMLLNAPFGQMVQNFAEAIQNAQLALDRNSLRTMEVMADPAAGVELPGGRRASMLELGLVPTFYHFTHATIEARISISITRSTALEGSALEVDNPLAMGAGAVDPAMANKYNYPPGDSSSIKSKLVSRPVPPALGLRLRQLRKIVAAS